MCGHPEVWKERVSGLVPAPLQSSEGEPFGGREKIEKPKPQESSKVKFTLYRPWRPLELREVEAPIFSDIRLIDDGKVVSPTRRPLLTPRKIPGTHFC
jgi:hypothetical protein